MIFILIPHMLVALTTFLKKILRIFYWFDLTVEEVRYENN